MAGTAVVTNWIWHVCGTFAPWDGQLLPWLAQQNTGAMSAAGKGGLGVQGSATGKGAHSPLRWLHKSGSCSLPAWKSVGIHRYFQPDLENAGSLHVVQKECESGRSFLKSSFLSPLSCYLPNWDGFDEE